MNFITPQQIRINAVLGVCARQRELVEENRRLQQQIRRKDKIAESVVFSVLFVFMLVCIIL